MDKAPLALMDPDTSTSFRMHKLCFVLMQLLATKGPETEQVDVAQKIPLIVEFPAISVFPDKDREPEKQASFREIRDDPRLKRPRNDALDPKLDVPSIDKLEEPRIEPPNDDAEPKTAGPVTDTDDPKRVERFTESDPPVHCELAVETVLHMKLPLEEILDAQ